MGVLVRAGFIIMRLVYSAYIEVIANGGIKSCGEFDGSAIHIYGGVELPPISPPITGDLSSAK